MCIYATPQEELEQQQRSEELEQKPEPKQKPLEPKQKIRRLRPTELSYTRKQQIFKLLKLDSTLTTRQIKAMYPTIPYNTVKTYVYAYNKTHKPKRTNLPQHIKTKKQSHSKGVVCRNCRKRVVSLDKEKLCSSCSFSSREVFFLDMSKPMKEWKWKLKKTTKHLTTPPPDIRQTSKKREQAYP